VGGATSSNIQYNTYSFDAVGNLKSRADLIRNVTDAFGYDEINRLTSATSNGVVTTYAYDSIGNITNKSMLVPISTAAANRTLSPPSPHGQRSVCYDANGNLTSGAGRVVSWSSFNMPTSITQV